MLTEGLQSKKESGITFWYYAPAFTKGKDKMDPIDVEKTRNISIVRIQDRSTQSCKVHCQLIILYPVTKREEKRHKSTEL